MDMPTATVARMIREGDVDMSRKFLEIRMAKIQLETFLPVVAQVAGLIATAVRSPNTATTAPSYLDMLAAIVGAGSDAYARLVELKALVQQMVLEDREPTNEEWAAMFRRSNDAHAAIQGVVILDEQDRA